MKSKKEKIFDAIFDTIYEDGNIANIRVSDIAKRAGIGKGTVYMYFASKEQMIFEAAKYLISSTMSEIINYEYDINKRFKDIFIGFLKEHLKALKKYSNMFYATSSTDFFPQLTPEFREMMVEVLGGIRKEYQQTLKKLVDIGAKEGIISPNPKPFEILTVAQMLFSTSGHFWQKEVPIETEDIDEFMQMQYNMMVKMFK